MVVILCNDFNEAKDAYLASLNFFRIEWNYIDYSDPFSLRVKTNDGLCYIFIDYRFKNVFKGDNVDFIDVDEFFGLDPLTQEWEQIMSDS